MAKVKAPLLSFSASGQIAETLVYFTWKGINAVRQYVIPSNPNTALQQIQRGYLVGANEAIHTALAHATEPLEEADQTAYSALASVLGKTMTWFNTVCKLWLDSKRAGDNPAVYHSGDITDPDHTAFDINVAFTEEGAMTMVAGAFYVGDSPTNLIHGYAAWVNPALIVGLTNQDMSAWMIAARKYYIQFRPDVADPCEGANSGIYSFWST